MKRLLSLFICAFLIVSGYIFVVSMASKVPTRSISTASASTMESGNKNTAKTIKRNSKKLAAKKNAIHQKKVLKVMEKDLTIKRSPSDQPETSPRDVHPSGQF
jgi:hypothetical protein